MMMHLG